MLSESATEWMKSLIVQFKTSFEGANGHKWIMLLAKWRSIELEKFFVSLFFPLGAYLQCSSNSFSKLFS